MNKKIAGAALMILGAFIALTFLTNWQYALGAVIVLCLIIIGAILIVSE